MSNFDARIQQIARDHGLVEWQLRAGVEEVRRIVAMYPHRFASETEVRAWMRSAQAAVAPAIMALTNVALEVRRDFFMNDRTVVNELLEDAAVAEWRRRTAS